MGPPLIGALMRMPTDAVRNRMVADLHAGRVHRHRARALRRPALPRPRRPAPVRPRGRGRHVARQALNYLLGQLEDAGYLVRTEDPDDQRAKTVHLTARGLVVRDTLRATVTAIESGLEQQLGTTAVRPVARAARGVERVHDQRRRPRLRSGRPAAGRTVR